MRAAFAFILFLATLPLAWAQPINDDCSNATTLSLTPAPDCPSTSPVTDSYSFSNVDATPVSPYPIFGTCPSGSTTGPAAEVWFTFTATANQTTITVAGLNDPNMVLYAGTNCISMQAINCTSGSGTASMATNTLIGETYFLLVSGGDIDDQGAFSLDVQSNNLCNSCAPPGAITLTTSPPPINGTYTSGQAVQVCVRVNEWDGNAAGTIEWLHAVTFEFGSGWDIFSLAPQPVPSCDGSGTWGWYESWIGCNSGDSFGPGFAYDSSSGIGCGGSANDGDPGNNWGDGAGGCSNIPNGSQPFFEFCVDINVSDCPPAITGGDLGIVIDVYSDGDSGSWTQTGCNSGQTYSTSASVVCCNDLPPFVNPFDPTCYTESNGSIEMWGNGAQDPGEVFNYFLFDSANNLVWECLACVGSVVTPSNLPPDTYTVTAINVATDCPRSEVITLNEPAPPMAMGEQTNEPCPGDDAILEGSVDVTGTNITYEWTGPSGQMVNGQVVAVQEAGNWEVVAIVDGCPSLPGSVTVEFVDFMTDIDASDTEVCAEEIFTLTATNGVSFTWTNMDTGENLGTGQMIDIALTNSATIQVEADNGQGCLAYSDIFITVNPLPSIVIDVAGNLCDNEIITLTALGAEPGGSYVWADTGTGENPRDLSNLPAGFYSFSVTGTDANGCSSSGEILFDVFASPMAELVLDNFQVCAGEPVTVTAQADDLASVFWYDGVAPLNANPIVVNPTGPTSVTADITNSNSCTVTVTTSISIEDPPPPISVFCGTSTPNSIEIFWDAQAGADYYEVTYGGNPTETVTQTSFTANNLMPGQMVSFTVLPVGAGICPMMPTTIECMTQDCAVVDLEIDPVADICLTTAGPLPFDLTFTTDTPGGATNWIGPGVTNNATGTFNPVLAGTGTHTITLEYTLGDCTYSATVDMTVYNTPTADFMIDPSMVCVAQNATVTYTGTGSPGATYDWSFGIDANATPGNGPGPHTVNWSTTGTKTISLTVTENGCVSETVTQTVEVDQELPAPVISCASATTNSVVFSWTDVPGALSYTVSVITGQTGTLSGNTYTVTGLAPGEAVTIEVAGVSAGFCGALAAQLTCSADDCPDFTIAINPVADICLAAGASPVSLSANVSGGAGGGTLTWMGPGVTGDQFDPVSAGEGDHVVTATYTEGSCSESEDISISVYEVPTSDFTVMPSTVCTNEAVTVAYTGDADVGNATFNWNFNGGTASATDGPGPITVTWPSAGDRVISLTVTENGCTSPASTAEVTVEPPLAAPVINCSSTTSSIIFSWDPVPGATGYDVVVTSGPMGTYDDMALTYTVGGLTSGDAVTIEVTALSGGACPDVTTPATCVAEDCPTDVVLDIDAIAPICLDGDSPPVDLNVNVSGGAGGGTLAWSGTGVTDTQNGEFDPQVAGEGTFTIGVTYQEGNCTYNNSIIVEVNAVPTSSFVAPAVVCQGDTVTITYDGSATAMATFDWTFNSGVVVTDNGATQVVTWPIAGDQSISLIVTENGCPSPTNTQAITVDAPLATPVISCTPTTTSVTFSWDPVPGATDYQVNVLSGPIGTYDGNALTYTVNGLMAGDMVDIEVVAIGPAPCGNSSTTASCTANTCPTDVVITIDPVAAICLDAGTDAFDLNATVTGGNGGGTLTWSGTGITNGQNGTFNPQVAGTGTFTITATYQEVNCTYTETIDLQIFAVPTSTFTAPAVVCQGDTITVSYTGDAGPGALLDWTFTNGVVVTDNGTEQIVTWPTAGDQTVSLIVTENGCPSPAAEQMLTVDAPLAAPVIDCNPTTSSVTFSWDPVPGASNYEVNILSGPMGTYDDMALTYTVTGLTAGDMVEIEVVAVGPAPCGNSSATASCTAADCPNVMISIDAVADICLDASTLPLALTANIAGGAGGGIVEWTGPGITDATNGTFSPADAGTGSHDITVTYTEDNCSWSAMTTITIFPVPTADFTADAEVCVGAAATLTYTGTASDMAQFDWSFDGGDASPGTGMGPQLVTWDEGGDEPDKLVRLTVTENGCTSPSFETTVTVYDSLAAPPIVCDSDNTSITFGWAPVVGATGYTVDVLNGPMGTLAADELSYSVSGLTPGEEVTIQVNVLTDSPCGGVTATATCNAEPCAPLLFADITYGPFCADAGTQMLVGELASGPAMGTFTWAGPGITDPDGTFDPVTAGIGDHDLTLTYSLTGCVYDTVYTVTVLPVPEAAFTIDSPICVTGSTTVTFTGTAGSGALYEWEFDGGMPVGSDAGPYTVSWTDAGTYTVSLTVTEEGCVSNTFTQEVVVDPVIEPVVITCAETTNTSITFAWDPVADADTYTVNVIQGPMGTQNGNTYTVDGLSPDDVVIIEVTASGASVCGASVATGECIAQACQPLTLALAGPTELCAGEDAQLTF
jgi:hypothetical protein